VAMKSLKQMLSPGIKKRALDLGLYGHSDYAPFVILGRSRVGSNLLRGLLNAHPQVATFGEIFRERESFDWDHLGYFQSSAMRGLAHRDPVAFLDAKVFGRYPTFVHAVGFKLFYYHARADREASVWPYLRDRTDVKVIHLKRRNLLQTHVSRKRAAQTGRWVDTAGNPDRAGRVVLDYQECLDDFVQTRAWEEESDRYFREHQTLQVEYERLAEDYRAESGRIQGFLGVDVRPVEPSTFQQARQPLSELIANHAELKERFAGTAWAEFFAD